MPTLGVIVFEYQSPNLVRPGRTTGRTAEAVIDAGASLSFYLDFLDVLRTAKNAGSSIKAVLIRDQTGREFRSSPEELEIAIANLMKWET